MLAIKSSRKQSLRLLSDEEDYLLSGIDFQTYYLGQKEIQIGNNDLDTVVEGIYSKYMYNGDINNSTQLTITVDTNQLVFRDVVSHRIEFIIALTNVKSVYCSNKKTKFPNAVIIVCCLPSQSTATVHVLHCLNQSQARDFYNAINRAFDYQEEATKASKPTRTNEDKGTAFSKADKNCEPNAVGAYKVNRTTSLKSRESNASTAPKKKETSASENTGLLGAEELVPTKNEPIQATAAVKEIVQTDGDDDARAKPRSRAKSSPQTKSAEGIGLLDNIDPDDGFDDEFTHLARNRSLSDNIKARFGR